MLIFPPIIAWAVSTALLLFIIITRDGAYINECVAIVLLSPFATSVVGGAIAAVHMIVTRSKTMRWWLWCGVAVFLELLVSILALAPFAAK